MDSAASDSTASDSITMVPVDRATLQQLVVKLLQRKGMFVAEAEIVAERMIDADRRGRFRDGVGSLTEFLEAMDLGDIDPRSRINTVTETPAIAVLDGGTGMGHLAATRGMMLAIDKANVVGTGTVLIRNSRPCGDLGQVALLAASQGVIGVVITSLEVEADGSDKVEDVAWAIPTRSGLTPSVNFARRNSLPDELSFLCGAVCFGLVGADAPPRKRKTLHVANVVEYGMVAINPEKFGVREAFLEKWHSPSMVVNETPSNEPTVPLHAAVARRLAELAAKIKFSVDW